MDEKIARLEQLVLAIVEAVDGPTKRRIEAAMEKLDTDSDEDRAGAQ